MPGRAVRQNGLEAVVALLMLAVGALVADDEDASAVVAASRVLRHRGRGSGGGGKV